MSDGQRKPRPPIQEVITDLLCGDRLENALDFVAFLNELQLPPRWTATNAWTAKYKGNTICTVRMHGVGQSNHGLANMFGLEPGSWHIGHWNSDSNLLGHLFLTHLGHYIGSMPEGAKETVWANVKRCTGCGRCTGVNKMVLGKEFQMLCRHGHLVITNPDAATLAFAKKLAECKLKYVMYSLQQGE